MALDAFLFPHHDIQAVVLSAGRSVFVHHLTQVASKRCRKSTTPGRSRPELPGRQRRCCSSAAATPRPSSQLTDGVAALDGVGGVMQGREAGVGPAALELNKQSFLGGTGEVARAFEGAVGATGTLFLLKEVKVSSHKKHSSPSWTSGDT